MERRKEKKYRKIESEMTTTQFITKIEYLKLLYLLNHIGRNLSRYGRINHREQVAFLPSQQRRTDGQIDRADCHGSRGSDKSNAGQRRHDQSQVACPLPTKRLAI